MSEGRPSRTQVTVSCATNSCGTNDALRGPPVTAVLDSPASQHRVIAYSLRESRKGEAQYDDSVRTAGYISYTTGDKAGDAKISNDGRF